MGRGPKPQSLFCRELSVFIGSKELASLRFLAFLASQASKTRISPKKVIKERLGKTMLPPASRDCLFFMSHCLFFWPHGKSLRVLFLNKWPQRSFTQSRQAPLLKNYAIGHFHHPIVCFIGMMKNFVSPPTPARCFAEAPRVTIQLGRNNQDLANL